MPSIAVFHPQVVHFALALLIVGVLLRLIALTGKVTFASPAATSLILMGTLASVLAVRSGLDAHGPVERMPGARPAVQEHEEWGIRARNAFLLVSGLELVVLAMSRWKPEYTRMVAMTSAVVGLGGSFVLFEAGEHGGQLVYNYAGGVGIRSGNPDDVGHLLVAGLYQQAMADRQAGRGPEGAALIDLAAQRFPQNLELQLMGVEWTTDVRKDPMSALARLDTIQVPASDTRMRIRSAMARANALVASGNVEAGRQVLLTLKGEFPTNGQVQRRLDELNKP